MQMWQDDTAIQPDMKLEAMSKPHAETVVGMVRIHKYLDGELDLKTEETERAARKELRPAQGPPAMSP